MIREKHPRIRVAGVLTAGEKILLVEHHRAGRTYFLLPGGGLEWGETCAAGLAREFLEELSLRVSVGPLLAVNESISPGGRRHIVNLAFRVLPRSGRLRLHPDTRLRGAVWVTRAQWGSLTFYPDIRKPLIAAWNRNFRMPNNFISTRWE